MNKLLRNYRCRLLQSALAVVAIALEMRPDTFASVEQIADRHRFQDRGTMPWNAHIAVIAISGKSLNTLGQCLVSRRCCAQLVNFFLLLRQALLICCGQSQAFPILNSQRQ